MKLCVEIQLQRVVCIVKYADVRKCGYEGLRDFVDISKGTVDICGVSKEICGCKAGHKQH